MLFYIDTFVSDSLYKFVDFMFWMCCIRVQVWKSEVYAWHKHMSVFYTVVIGKLLYLKVLGICNGMYEVVT